MRGQKCLGMIDGLGMGGANCLEKGETNCPEMGVTNCLGMGKYSYLGMDESKMSRKGEANFSLRPTICEWASTTI